jgi:hypothetical protein
MLSASAVGVMVDTSSGGGAGLAGDSQESRERQAYGSANYIESQHGLECRCLEIVVYPVV